MISFWAYIRQAIYKFCFVILFLFSIKPIRVDYVKFNYYFDQIDQLSNFDLSMNYFNNTKPSLNCLNFMFIFNEF